MAKYESSIKQVGSPQSRVYTRLSDLSNLAQLKEKLDDPAAVEQLKATGGVNDEQLEKVRQQLESVEFTTDSISANIPAVGSVEVRIVEREPEKCIKLETTQSPIPMKLWIQLLPVTDETSKMKLTVDASLNPFIKVIVEKPLKQGLERLADVLSKIPY